MDRHQRLQRQTVDAPVERLHSRSLQASSLQTNSFGVQKRPIASAPASKAELWDNYQSNKQLNQNGGKLQIQTKVKIGQPGDKYEQEADSVAEQVMSMSEPTQVQRIESDRTTRAQENLINEHKANQEILAKGWTEDKIDELVKWCKSEIQYNSFINNLSCAKWQVLKTSFNGEDLPNKVLDAWVAYQAVNKEITTLQQFTGYKCSSGKEWNSGTDNVADWSACYIGTTMDQATGYIGEAGQSSGIASMWQFRLKKPLQVLLVRGGFIDRSDIPQEFKALVLKKVLRIDVNANLLESLKKKGMAYLGSEGEAGQEMAMPWGLLDTYLEKRRIKEYEVGKNYKIDREYDV